MDLEGFGSQFARFLESVTEASSHKTVNRALGATAMHVSVEACGPGRTGPLPMS